VQLFWNLTLPGHLAHWVRIREFGDLTFCQAGKSTGTEAQNLYKKNPAISIRLQGLFS
jgi:hypothetical protein